jgi:ATP-binding protein involved in chromosome partitioning
VVYLRLTKVYILKMTVQEVQNVLAEIPVPGTNKDLIYLKMIDKIEVSENKISFNLTVAHAMMKPHLQKASTAALQEKFGAETEVAINFITEIGSNRMDKKDVLPGVKNIIAVGSGKGGVGKSTVSVNLAFALAKSGAKVGIMDADIYGPSIPIMLGIRGERPMMEDVDGKGKIIPIDVTPEGQTKGSLKAMSIGLLIDDKQAVVWRGPMASSALKQFVTDVNWGELDYLIIDLPPGTGDIHLTMVQTIPVTGAVIVSTPQEVAMADAKKAIMMFDGPQIKVPILGLVENMAYFTPAELPENKYYIFGKGGGKQLSEQFEIPYLGQIPLVQSIREGGDEGKPAVLNDEDKVTQEAFTKLAESIAQHVSIRNANLDPTQIVEITT